MCLFRQCNKEASVQRSRCLLYLAGLHSTNYMQGLQMLCRLGYGSMLAGFRDGKYP